MDRIDDFEKNCGSDVDQTDDIQNVDQKWIGLMIFKKSVDEEWIGLMIFKKFVDQKWIKLMTQKILIRSGSAR